MKLTIDEKNKTVTIVLPMLKPTPSKSGKTLLIAGTGGFEVADEEYKGSPVKVSVNVCIKNPEYNG